MPAHRKLNPAQKKQLIPPAPTGSLRDEFVTENDLIQLTGKTLRTLRWWNQKRIGPPRIVFGQTILYRKAAVIAWLTQHEEKIQPTK
jgi:hypothetical protein